MRRVLLCTLKAVESRICLPEVPEVTEVMRCVLFCMLEAVEGGLCSLEVLEVLEAMRHMLDAVESEPYFWRC